MFTVCTFGVNIKIVRLARTVYYGFLKKRRPAPVLTTFHFRVI